MLFRSIVVWVVSGYDALASKFDEFEEGYLGRYQVLVLSKQGERGERSALPESVLTSLQQDSSVLAAEPMFESRRNIRPAKQGKTTSTPPASIPREVVPGQLVRPGAGFNQGAVLVGTDAELPIHSLREGRWLSNGNADKLEGVLTAGTADQFQVKTGDTVLVSQNGGETAEVTIVGIVNQPDRLPGPRFRIGLPPSREQSLTDGPATSALYVSMGNAMHLTGEFPELHFIGLTLKEGMTPEAFQDQWDAKLSQMANGAHLRSTQDVAKEIDQSTTVEGVRSQAYAATGISLLAALFIIFTTLSMGVNERIRQFAMLRAIGLSKSQIGAMLTFESIGLGLIGWGGGLVSGWGLLKLLNLWHPELLEEGAVLGAWCILLSGACAFGGALAASILPAWQATRVSPLDAMVIQAKSGSHTFPWRATLAGLLLIAINPTLVFFIPMPDTMRYLVSAAIGCVCMAIGFLLLAPAVILISERVLGPVLAKLLGIHPQLLTSQLSTNLWRSLGITTALTLGLGLFVTMQTWGYSMLGPFTPGDWVPDLIVKLPSGGIPEEAIETIRNTKGVIASQFVPLAVEQVKFAGDVTGAEIRSTASRQDNCVMIGVDANAALGGDDPLFDFRFVEGTRDEAIQKLQDGRYCLVPDHFSRESGLNVGDKFGVIPPEDPDHPIEYEIAGVVSMDGWHWMSKGGLRNRTGGRSAGLMFSPYQQVKEDFGIKKIGFFWMNTDGTLTEEEMKEEFKKAISPSTPVATNTMARGLGRNNNSIEIRTREGVRKSIRERASGIIWALCQLPLITLAVTVLGVVNTIAASVRARRWEMGVLRAMGTTRGALMRLILAEAVLIGVAACLLSVSFGVLAGYCGTGVTRYINVRGGLVTPLVIPWEQIGIGFAITLAMCLIAAVGPALMTARTNTLSLLKSGRASA